VAFVLTVRNTILLADADPTAVCLRETFLTADKTINVNNLLHCVTANVPNIRRRRSSKRGGCPDSRIQCAVDVSDVVAAAKFKAMSCRPS